MQSSEVLRGFFMEKRIEHNTKPSLIATWSGGKDSCFATYLAIQQGYTISYLANTISVEYQRVGLHGVQDTLIQEQADAVGIPLLQKAVEGVRYEQEFTTLLAEKKREVKGIVFGDIFLDECRTRNEGICKKLRLFALEPLWGKTSLEILRDFIDTGFEAYVVSCQAALLWQEWVGRRIDASFLEDIQKVKGVDPCGENGEFHTFVTNGPIFRKEIVLQKTAKVLRNGYWFLDIQKYKVVEKEESL